MTEAGYKLGGKGLLDLSDPMIRAEIEGKTGQNLSAVQTQGHRPQTQIPGLGNNNCSDRAKRQTLLSRNGKQQLAARGKPFEFLTRVCLHDRRFVSSDLESGPLLERSANV